MPPLAASGGEQAPGETLFELTTIGQSVRVAAIDAATGVEVVVVGPVSASPSQLKALASRKLQLRLTRGETGWGG
jgi:hypothetical protein